MNFFVHNRLAEDNTKVVPSIADNEQFADVFSSDSSSDEELQQTTTQTDQNIPTKFRNEWGVEILPSISEEDELSSDVPSKENFEDEKNKLSQINAIIEDLILKGNEDCVSHTILDVNNLQTMNTNSNWTIKNYSFPKNFKIKKSSSCNCCSLYRKYLFRKRLREVKDFSSENFLKPLVSALRCGKFYPVIFTKSSILLFFILYLTSIPYIAISSEKDKFLPALTYESPLLLTIVSFAWFCFLALFLSWVMNAGKNKSNLVFVVGLAVYTSVSIGKLKLFLSLKFYSLRLIYIRSLIL